MWIVSVIVCVLLHAILCAAQCNQLVPVTDCVCPGQNVIYQCSVMGGSFTVYSGTSFQCRRGDITLRNDQFESGNSIGVCNGEQFNITGRGLTEESNCYTSQVNISLGEAVSQSTVSCAVEGTQVEVVDTAEINLSTEAFSPPSGVSLGSASPSHLTFTWNPVSRSCPSLVYSIVATNCGTCPDRTSRTNINCTDFSTSLARSGGLTCILSIQTVICDRTSTPIAGNATSMSYVLKVPSAPSLNITPVYDERGQLKGFYATVALSDPNPIFVYDSVDGSARTFTLTVMDGNSMDCDSATIVPVSPESCDVNGICYHYSQKICPTISRTTIAVYVSNVLGRGSTNTTTIDNRNNFVKVEVDLETIKCIFLNPPPNNDGIISCIISFESGQIMRSGRMTSDNTVTIILSGLLEGIEALRYNITASNGTHQVVVEDVLSLGSPQTSNATGGIVAASVIIVFLIAVLIMAVVFYFWVSFKSICNVQDSSCLGNLYFHMQRTIFKPKMQLKQLSGDDCHLQKGQDGKTLDTESNVGFIYLEAEDGEVLSPTVKVIAQHKAGNFFAINGVDVARKFVNETRQVRPAKQRKLGFGGYRLFIQNRVSCVELTGDDEILLCTNNPAPNNILSKVQPKLPSGVIEAKNWFEFYTLDSTTTFGQFCTSKYGCNLQENRRSDDKLRIFYSYEPECYFRSTEVQSLNDRLVMAMSDNHQLYEDRNKVLANAALGGIEIKGWRKIYFEETGDTPLEEGSEVLFYNPNLTRVREPYEMYFVADSEVDILEFIKEKRGESDQESCSLEHVYKQCDVGNQLKDGMKFMARDERGNLCTGSRKVDATRESYKWKFVFTQVTDAGSKAQRGARLLYCRH